MAISITTRASAVYEKVVDLADTDVLHIVKNVTEDTDFQLTNNTGGTLHVTITVRATS